MAAISDLSFDRAEISSNRGSPTISLKGVSGNDLLACADDGLINELLDAIGENRVIEHFDIEVAGE